MNIDSSSLTMVNFTTNNSRIGVSFHFKTRYSISVYVAAFKITLKHKEKEGFQMNNENGSIFISFPQLLPHY